MGSPLVAPVPQVPPERDARYRDGRGRVKRAQRERRQAVGEPEGDALEDVGLADEGGLDAEGAAGRPRDEGAGEDHVLAALLDAGEAAALGAGEGAEEADGGVDLRQR